MYKYGYGYPPTINQLGTLLNQYLLDGDTFNNGKLIISFDDGLISHYNTVFPLLQSKSKKATFYVPTNGIGGANMSWDNIIEMRNAGMDIEAHNESSTALMEAANALYAAQGLPAPEHTAYDSGVFTDALIDETDDFRKSGRGVSYAGTGSYYINRKSDKYTLPSLYIGNPDVTYMNTIKSHMDYIAVNKKALTMYIHNVTTDGGTDITKTSTVEEIIDYAASIGLDIITMKQLYDLMLYVNLRAVRYSDTQINLTFKHRLTATHKISVERSVDGINYTEINLADVGVTSYADTGLNVNSTYYYRVRAVSAGSYLPYSMAAQQSTNYDTWTVGATGTGAGVSKLTLSVNANTDLKLDGTARFYSDAAGTLNESTTQTVLTGGSRVIYFRCSSGTVNLKVSKHSITAFLWESYANAAYIGFDIAKHNLLTSANIDGNNSVYGIISGLTSLTSLFTAGSCTIRGSIEPLTALTVAALAGLNTMSGSIAGLTQLRYLVASASCLVTVPTVINVKGLCSLTLSSSGLALTSANKNQILADVWANRDEPKLRNERSISIAGGPGSGAISGQGIVDKANLEAYRSPNNDPAKALWTINA